MDSNLKELLKWSVENTTEGAPKPKVSKENINWLNTVLESGKVDTGSLIERVKKDDEEAFEDLLYLFEDINSYSSGLLQMLHNNIDSNPKRFLHLVAVVMQNNNVAQKAFARLSGLKSISQYMHHEDEKLQVACVMCLSCKFYLISAYLKNNADAQNDWVESNGIIELLTMEHISSKSFIKKLFLLRHLVNENALIANRIHDDFLIQFMRIHTSETKEFLRELIHAISQQRRISHPALLSMLKE